MLLPTLLEALAPPAGGAGGNLQLEGSCTTGHLQALQLMAKLFPGYCDVFQLPLPETVEEGIWAVSMFPRHREGHCSVRQEATVVAEPVDLTTAVVPTNKSSQKAFTTDFAAGKKREPLWL